MKNFMLVSNSGKNGSMRNSERIREILERNGCRCTADQFTKALGEGKYLYVDPNCVPEDTEAVLVLGGDGTFIHSAKDIIDLGLPVFGINNGNLGYLTEVDIDGFEDSLKKIIAGDYYFEDHITLECTVTTKDGDRVLGQGLVFNDISLNRYLTTGIANFDIYINGIYLNSYDADGVLIATPLGSTGYNLSAGGPLVMPTADIVLVTPICAHTLNSRSIVFPADVTIDIITNPAGLPRMSCLICDGEKMLDLSGYEKITIKESKKVIKTLKTSNIGFVENLGVKLR